MRRLKNAKGQAIVELVVNVIVFAIMIALTAGLSSYLYLEHLILTAAREGARAAALDGDFALGNTATATTNVQTVVKDFMRNTAGQVLNDANSEINVTAPDPAGVKGDRTVGVEVIYEVANPVAIADFIAQYGSGAADANAPLSTFRMEGSAMMRYEE